MMVNILIYGGLSLLLLGCLIILIASVKGLLLTKKMGESNSITKADIKDSLKGYSRAAFIVVILGMIATMIGIILGLN